VHDARITDPLIEQKRRTWMEVVHVELAAFTMTFLKTTVDRITNQLICSIPKHYRFRNILAYAKTAACAKARPASHQVWMERRQ